MVNALKSTACAVVLPSSETPSPAPCPARWTMWTPLSTPMPRSRGSTQMLTKLSDTPNATVAAAVSSTASNSGSITTPTSMGRRQSSSRTRAMATSAHTMACCSESRVA